MKFIKSKKSFTSLVSILLCFCIGLGLLGVGAVTVFKNAFIPLYANSEIIEFFHDQGGVFMQPLEPSKTDSVTLRLRTHKGNVTNAAIRFTLDVEVQRVEDAVYHEIPMVFEGRDETGYFDYYVGIVPAQQSPYYYHFMVENRREKLYISGPETYSVGKPHLSVESDYYVMPGFSTPDWAKGALWYSIMPDSFYNGDITNDKYTSSGVIQNAWGTNHYSGNDYNGGDFNGITQKLDYLKELNVTALFINPIWTSGHQAGYGSNDLMQIDSAMGNEESFANLVNSLHDNDIRIMLDGVFRYAHGAGYLYNNQGLYPMPGGISPGDPYYDMFLRAENGQITLDWGQPVLDFSSPATREYVYSTENSIMQYYIRNFDIDGWRMDVGPSLAGSDPHNWGNAEQILKDMRRYIKDAREDVLFLSEHGDGALLYDYTLDSRWSHYNFTMPMRSYMSSRKAENVLLSELYNSIVRLPAPIRNTVYNYTASHDLSKSWYIANGDIDKVLASNLLTMTYVGAPSIFFGDEVGMTGEPNLGVAGAAEPGAAPSSFGPMDWDKNNWNIQLHNQQIALGKLRSEYASVYKDGAYVSLLSDIQNNLMAFGRFNGEQSCITVTNSGGKTAYGVEIEVNRAGVKDGTILTDYLTGRTYKVRGGKVAADISAGGAVLVTGGAGSHLGELALVSINNGQGTLVKNADGSYDINGKGMLSGTSDKIIFANRLINNNFSFEADYRSGSYTMAVRGGEDKSAPYYALTIKNGKGEVYARKTPGAAATKVREFAVRKDTSYRIQRADDNYFSVYEYVQNEWQQVSGTISPVAMPEDVYAGFAAADGKGTFGEPKFTARPRQYLAEFESNLGSMFTATGGAEVSDGALNLTGSDGANFVLAHAPTADFTFSAYQAASSVSGRQGITAYTNAGNYVSLSYNGENVALGITVNGAYSLISSVPYSGTSVFLQLEKIGARYYARYSSNGTDWPLLDGYANANYSEIKAGLFAEEDGSAKFDYARFGDGQGYAEFKYYGYINFNLDGNDGLGKINALRIEQGSFEYFSGGISSANTSKAKLSVGPAFYGFKIDSTLSAVEHGVDGYYGIRFGAGYNTDDGYTLTVANGGRLVLRDGAGTEISAYQIPGYTAGTKVRLVVMLDTLGNLRVYTGADPMLVIDKAIQVNEGHISYIGDGARYSVYSRNESQLGHSAIGNGNYTMSTSGVGENAQNVIALTSNENGYAYAGLLSQGYSDVLFAGNVSLRRTTIVNRATFGLLLDGTAGRTYQNGGVMVSTDDAGTVAVRTMDKILTSVTLDYNPASFYLIIVSQGGQIRVYVDKYGSTENSEMPVLSWDIGRTLGGTLNVFAEYASATVTNAYAYALGAQEDYTQLKPYKVRPISEPPLPEPIVSDGQMQDFYYDGFSSQNDLAKFFKYGGGIWDYNNDILTINSGPGNWYSGATLALGKTAQEYDLEVSMRLTSPGGLAGVLINKARPDHNHEMSGILVYSNSSAIFAYAGQGDMGPSAAPGAGFYTVRISQRKQGVNHIVTIYVNDTKAFDFVIENTGRATSVTGYVSLVCGVGSAEFEYVRYTNYVPD